MYFTYSLNGLVKGWKLTLSLCLGLGEGPLCRSWPFAAVSPNKCFPNPSETGGAHCQLGADPDAGSREARSPQWLLQVGHCSRTGVLPSLVTFDREASWKEKKGVPFPKFWDDSSILRAVLFTKFYFALTSCSERNIYVIEKLLQLFVILWVWINYQNRHSDV